MITSRDGSRRIVSAKSEERARSAWEQLRARCVEEVWQRLMPTWDAEDREGLPSRITPELVSKVTDGEDLYRILTAHQLGGSSEELTLSPAQLSEIEKYRVCTEFFLWEVMKYWWDVD